MDPEYFAPQLVPDQTSLVKLIENYLFEFEATQSKIKIELRELNVYSAYLIVVRYYSIQRQSPLFSPGFILKASHRDLARRKYDWVARDCLPHAT